MDKMSTDQAAVYLGYKPSTLKAMRRRGSGPKWTRTGIVFYVKADLDQWLAAKKRG